MLYLCYRPRTVVRLKTEHHPICVTQENLPTTNIYTQIDFNHSDLESRNGRNTLKYIKRNQNNYIYICSKAKAMELVVRLICSSYLFFVMKFEEKKAIVSVQTKF